MGGKPVVELNLIDVNAHVNNVEVEIHGGVLCHLFKGDIENSIKDGVKNDFPKKVPSGLEDALAQSSEYVTGLLGNMTGSFDCEYW